MNNAMETGRGMMEVHVREIVLVVKWLLIIMYNPVHMMGLVARWPPIISADDGK